MNMIRQSLLCLLWAVTVSAQTPGQPLERSGVPATPSNSVTTGALPEQLKVDLGEGVAMEFVLIKPGKFFMGSKRYANARPVHKVAITEPFYLGKYEVTQEQWRAVMGRDPSHFDGAKRPVEQVSWNDCQEFLAKLQPKEPRYRFALPTEAQWEYACRAGSDGDYCDGAGEDRLGNYAWYSANSGNETHPVGGKKPNAWGLYDMHGNVREWCANWYGPNYYTDSPDTNPTGPDRGSVRVLRGGSWRDNASVCRSAYRDINGPSNRDNNTGLRVLLSAR